MLPAMSGSISTELTIATPAMDSVADAVRLAVSGHYLLPADDEVRAVLQGVQTGQMSTEGLRIARRRGKLVGAIWVNVTAGRVATVWGPTLVPLEPSAIADALLDSQWPRLASHGVRLAQAVIDVGSPPVREHYLRHAFVHAADLVHMVAPRARFPAQPPETGMEFLPYSAAQDARFGEVIQSTYEATLDCPALDGVRDLPDVLDGYRATGQFRADWWLLVRQDGCDVGCLLMTPYPQQRHAEIIYMGVVPQARGRRLGLAIARHAQWLARRAKMKQLLLAVDAQNVPALAAYGDAGFTEFDRRSIYLKLLRR